MCALSFMSVLLVLLHNMTFVQVFEEAEARLNFR